MLETDLFTSPFLMSALISLAAGILSFLSPCVLPIVPAYLAYMAGITIQDAQSNKEVRNRKTLYVSISFVLGLSTVFILLGAAVSYLGRLIIAYQNILEIISGFVIVVFGLNFVGLVKFGFGREIRFELRELRGGIIVSYVLGLAFAFGWTPCIGPILGSILAIVLQEETVLKGVVLMTFYAMGMGLPFILTGLFLGRAIIVQKKLKIHMGLIEKLMGMLLIFTGLMILSGTFSSVSFFLLDYFPWLSTVG